MSRPLPRLLGTIGECAWCGEPAHGRPVVIAPSAIGDLPAELERVAPACPEHEAPTRIRGSRLPRDTRQPLQLRFGDELVLTAPFVSRAPTTPAGAQPVAIAA